MTRKTRNLLATAPLATAFAVIALVASGQPASAHARLERSTPLSGSALDSLPQAITLEFSEPVVPDSVNLILEREEGSALELAGIEVAHNNRAVTVRLAASDVSPGIFQIRWSVRSATDGHDSAGLIAFSAGTGRAPPATSAGTERDPWWLIAVRAVWLLALALIASRIIAGFGVGQHPVGGWGVVGGSVAFVAGVFTIRPWSGFESSSEAVRWLAVAALFGLVSGCLGAVRGRLALSASAVAWLAAIGSLSAAGHAAGDGLAIAAAIIHVSLALAWLGTLLALVLNARSDHLRRDLARYSRLAIVGVPLLGIAGVVLAAMGISDQRGLTGSNYGGTLLVKLAIVALVLVIAATNRWITLHWIDRRPAAEALDAQSRWVLLAELSALGLVVALASALSATAPPGDAAIVQVASPLRTVDQQADLDGLSIRLAAEITGQVDDRFTVGVLDKNGRQPAGIQRVIITTSFVDPATGETVAGEQFDAIPAAGRAGAFEFSAMRLARQAVWSIELTVRRSGLFDLVQPFTIDSRAWHGEGPRVIDRDWRWPIFPTGAWALLAVALLLPAAGVVMIRRNGQVAPVSGAILMIALAMIAGGFTVQAWQRSAERSTGHDLTAPPAPDLVAAQADYAARCLGCHGSDGGGLNDADPLHRHAAGTNLIDPRTIALSDGDLFTLVSSGVGDSDMPAYDRALTPEQRWNLVAYVRELQEKRHNSGSSP